MSRQPEQKTKNSVSISSFRFRMDPINDDLKTINNLSLNDENKDERALKKSKTESE